MEPVARKRVGAWFVRVLIGVVSLALLLVVATGGIAYYFSGVLLQVDNSPAYPLTVAAVDGSSVTLPRDVYTERSIVLGLAWDRGYAILDKNVRIHDDTVVRTVSTMVRGSLRAGLAVSTDSRMYQGDPATRGLTFDEVSVPSPVGGLPSWLAPSAATTAKDTTAKDTTAKDTTAKDSTAKDSAEDGAANVWVIALHGRRGTRAETLRILPTVAATGLPTLVVGYRNDPDAPASPDGMYHLGDTEWRDVAAAIQYARANGATGAVLYGWSMGGGMALTALRRMAPADASFVRGLVLDSPTVDWTSVLDHQGAERGLPSFVTWTAMRVIETRAGFDLDDLDQRPHAQDLRVPTLLFVDDTDETVPHEPAVAFAGSRPDLVTLVSTTGGGHTASWNVDPARYESAVRTFLDRFA